MKRISTLILSFCLVLFSVCSFSQVPTMGTVDDDTVIVNSGANFILIPNVTDGTDNTQDITFTVVSSATGILAVDSVTYNVGDNFAVIHVSDQGVVGTSTLTIDADDADGSAVTQNMDVYVGTYQKPGLHYQVHDVVFWKEEIPLNSNPLFDTIINQSADPSYYIENVKGWDNIPITVGSGITETFRDGHDLWTGIIKGYLVPPTTGDYTFYQICQSDHALFLSSDSLFDNARSIIYRGQNSTVTGSVVDSSLWSWSFDPDTTMPDEYVNEWASEPVTLTAGKVYAFYSVQWNIHFVEDTIRWEGPGISKEIIQDDYLMYNYDPIFPTVASNLTLATKGVDYLRVSWTEGTDNNRVAGYNIYVDGLKVNSAPVDGNVYKITGLTADTKYSIVVTTEDAMGNESPISNIINATTHGADATNPTPPTSINVDIASGTALALSWEGAIDIGTEVVGYYLYVDGELYNTMDLIYEDSVILKPLEPSTNYDITIEAVDAAGLISATSVVFSVATTKFDPFGTDLGVKKARLHITMENIAHNEGLGVNFNYKDGISEDEMNLCRDMNTAGIRWGALTANPLNFEDYQGTSAAGITIAEFIDSANQMGAWPIICSGVDSATDWLTNSATFTNFLEYVNGTSGTYADARIAEGYTNSVIENSKGVIFEFGNEVWGGVSHDAQIGQNYNNYAAWCREKARGMKASDNWDDKIMLAYSGRGPDASNINTAVIDGDSGLIEILAISGYMGGNLNYDPEIDPGESELDYYKNGIGMMVSNFTSMEALQLECLEETRGTKGLYFYEGNMTTSSYNARLGQAMVYTDYCLGSIEIGHIIPTLFHLTGGQWRITEPSQSYKRLPLFLAAKYFNTFCKGEVLETTVESDYQIYNSNGYAIDAEPVGAYAYTSDTNFSVVLVSRDFENDYYVDINLPDDFNHGVAGKQYIISGTDFNTFDADVDTIDIPAFADSLLVRVPKHGMVVVHFSGDDQNFTPHPHGYYKYTKQETITVTSATGETAIENKGGTLIINAAVAPANSFSTSVVWELLDNDINVLSSPSGDMMVIRASVNCEDTGIVIVRAFAIDDETVYDEIAIKMDPCGLMSSIEESKVAEYAIQVFPNPVTNELFIVSGQLANIKLVNLQGQTMLNKDIEAGVATLDVTGMQKGAYILIYNSEKQSFTEKIIIE